MRDFDKGNSICHVIPAYALIDPPPLLGANQRQRSRRQKRLMLISSCPAAALRRSDTSAGCVKTTLWNQKEKREFL